MDPRIVAAQRDDAALVYRITQEAYAEHLGVLNPPSSVHRETVADVERDIDHGGVMLAWDGDEAVGCLRYAFHADHVYIGRVSVLPGHRRRGIASFLIQHVEVLARDRGYAEVRLGVRASLPSNLALYQRLGYQVVATEPHPRGPDAVMWMTKTPAPAVDRSAARD